MKNPLLAYDNRDDRREIHALLSRLSPDRRIAFVQAVFRKIHLKGAPAAHPLVARSTLLLAEQARVDDRADERLTLDLFFDLAHSCQQYEGFHWPRVLDRLVRLAKAA